MIWSGADLTCYPLTIGMINIYAQTDSCKSNYCKTTTAPIIFRGGWVCDCCLNFQFWAISWQEYVALIHDLMRW